MWFFGLITRLVHHHLSWVKVGFNALFELSCHFWFKLPLFQMWIIVFVAWHGVSPKALLDISCSSSKWCPWFTPLVFGFGPPRCLSFRCSSTPFVHVHPFCFVTKSGISFLFPLLLFCPISIWHCRLAIFPFVSTMVFHPSPYRWINWALGN